MAISRKIRQSGNSASVTLPKTVLEALEIGPGDEVIFDIVGDAVIMRRREGATALARSRAVYEVAAERLERLLIEAPEDTVALSETETAAVQEAIKRGLRR
jgi:antitoxin component of MazEF toxin-antitoxin module